MQDHTRVAAVIVNYRTGHLIEQCIAGIAREKEHLSNLKLVVVDNNSCYDSIIEIQKLINKSSNAKWIELLSLPINGGFGWANNQAIMKLMSWSNPPEFILLINPDAIMQPNSLRALIAMMKAHNDCGAAGSQLFNLDGSLAGSAFHFPSVGQEWSRGHGITKLASLAGIPPIVCPFGNSGKVDWVTGASVLLRSAALQQAGLFDTGFFLYFEEVELMHRFLRRGWRCYHAPDSHVMHIAGAATGIVDGKSAKTATIPDYIFHSRRRYFGLTGGRRTVEFAARAWLAGDSLASIRSILTRTGDRTALRTERDHLLRLGYHVRASDLVPAITFLGDPIGELPAWMAYQ